MRIGNHILSVKTWLTDNGVVLERFLNGSFDLDIKYRPKPNERTFNLSVVLVNSDRTGAVYYVPKQVSRIEISDLCGLEYDGNNIENGILELAALDSMVPERLYQPSSSFTIEGTLEEKSDIRARIVATETMKLSKGLNAPKILQIGVVQNIAQNILKLGGRVDYCDLDKELKKQDFFLDKTFISPSSAVLSIGNYDVVIATGMTVTTGAFLDLSKICKAMNVPLLVYAETCAYLAEWMIHMGANAVVSEPFPYYIFTGKNEINVFRS